LWCTDYKGEFLLGNRQYCYPLTVTDHASRYLLTWVQPGDMGDRMYRLHR
jgi:transposase InsO family protein